MTDTVPIIFVVAAALTDATGAVLVQQRPAGKSLAGLWEFPGGKVDPGETPEAALVRELDEELSISVDPAVVTPIAFASHPSDGRHLVMLLYRVRTWSGEARAIEAADLRWVTINALRALPMPAADVALIDDLARFMKG